MARQNGGIPYSSAIGNPTFWCRLSECQEQPICAMVWLNDVGTYNDPQVGMARFLGGQCHYVW